ncbi:rcc1 domain-containing protein 1 [Plakobranchus ocellatus]|uniref:Rcc1 domain-containing protein 1 n=1 Tax=Plakobranchus ocellatus TaxID=259542 RepID=A0AAV4DQA6_9GAST|nr:rcc1 domain-containing protein 1 [Plakobranchus ocellatus]
MAKTLYACGFNGFAQLTGFQSQIREGWLVEPKSQSDKKLDTTVSITYPITIGQLAEAVLLKSVIFTWSRIATNLQKDGNHLCLIVGRVERDTDSSLCSSFDEEAVCATDAHILLQGDQDRSKFSCLCDGDVQSQPLVLKKEEQTNSKPIRLHASHKDIYYSQGSIEFGKLTHAEPEIKMKSNFINSGAFHLLPIDMSVKIATVSCGREHVLLLSSFGCVYSCGLGSRGQLGHGDVEMEQTPRLVEALEGVRMLSCQAGGWHSASVSECGDLYTWGWNESGQLGLGCLSASQETDGQVKHQDVDAIPGLVTEPQCAVFPGDIVVKAVACGSRHTVALSDCGQVFCCGWNAYGQLGLKHKINQSGFVQMTSLDSTCTQIFAGHWCSMFLC